MGLVNLWLVTIDYNVESMRRNLLLFSAVLLSVILIVNSSRRLSSLRNTSKKVGEAAQQLEALKRENADLKRELEYKKSDQFKEQEIRDKLGMVKNGEVMVILPNKQDGNQLPEISKNGLLPNYIKWWNLFFRS